MSTFSKFIDSIVRDGNDGKQFERFVKWFLKRDPYWATQVEKVWLWREYPDRWRNDDQGIDLIIKYKNKEIWAVQAKCFNSENWISRHDIDSFLAESSRTQIKGRLLIASTDRLGKNTLRVIRGQEKPFVTFLRSDFECSSISYPSTYKLLSSVKKRDKLIPYPYQKDAIKAVTNGFKNVDRGQLIMACGTGKTLVSFWIKERMKSKNTLVLVPSLSLLSQTVREWSSASAGQVNVLCVCSDKSVGNRVSSDELVQSIQELPFPVHSDKKTITRFLKNQDEKVVFSTYQSTPVLVEILKNKTIPAFDLAVADEAHRCAAIGVHDSVFINILDRQKIRAKKRLFVTATPRTFSSNISRAAEKRGIDVIGMDDENIFGRPFYKLSFSKAINSTPPLLTDYKVVVIGVDDKRVNEWIKRRELVKINDAGIETDAQTLASQIGLIKAVQEHKLKRVITYHNRVSRAKDYSEAIGTICKVVPRSKKFDRKIESAFVSGAMNVADRNQKLKELENVGKNETRILANARCLQEGIDIPALDGIAFIDPKNSPIDITQSVGRAIRLSKDKRIGLIVLPVFIQRGNNVDDLIATSAFKRIWTVLNALKAHDETLANELDTIRRSLGRNDTNPNIGISLSKIVFDLPRAIDDKFADEIKTLLVEVTTESWEFWFGLLEAYVEEFGTALVPDDYKTLNGYKLGKWVGNQRTRKDGLIAENRVRLEALPKWTWNVSEQQWEVAFRHLLEHVQQKGTALVRRSYLSPDGYKLGQWVVSQRSRRERLTNDNVARLAALPGWVWDGNDAQWEEGFDYLEKFVEENKHALVPMTFVTPDGYTLGRWTAIQRSRNRALRKDRRNRLKVLPGWVWNVNAHHWEEGFRHLTQYVTENGTALVKGPYTSPDGYKLSQWVVSQRSVKKSLSEGKRVRLESLPGWVWDRKTQQWENGFSAVTNYIAEYGDSFVPKEYKTSDGLNLGHWVTRNRQTKNSMSAERRERLESLRGWIWNTLDHRWENGFRHLEEFCAECGHSNVPLKYKSRDGYELGSWVVHQRSKQDQITVERRAQLEDMAGWVWHTFEAKWEEGMQHLQHFIDQNGHAKVPSQHQTSSGFNLGGWVVRNRGNKENMNKNRRTRLSELPGWVWRTRKSSKV
jgi:superfamily II DNA or RNA helicase